MYVRSISQLLAILLVSLTICIPTALCGDKHGRGSRGRHADQSVQLGPRPFYLLQDMDQDTPAKARLKKELKECADGPFYKTDFSIGHRGAGLQFPEHTRESYMAAARMGAGILECDVTFTKDRELVCRHSQCDLHTTTNILTPIVWNSVIWTVTAGRAGS